MKYRIFRNQAELNNAVLYDTFADALFNIRIHCFDIPYDWDGIGDFYDRNGNCYNIVRFEDDGETEIENYGQDMTNIHDWVDEEYYED